MSKSNSIIQENLEKLIKKLEERIIILEEFSKCYFCNNISLLFNCHDCNKKICKNCSTTIYTKSFTYEDISIIFCKECK
jgi:hypothetical protein